MAAVRIIGRLPFRRLPMRAEPSPRVEGFIDLLILVFICIYILNILPWDALVSNTAVTGGDTASHYQTVIYLRDYLFPQGKIIGWYPGNYGGHPNFLMYFPLLFVLSALAGYMLPLTVAFKWATIIGPILLPFCTYCMLRLAKTRFPIPALAAVGSVLFLFNGSNSTWGGNFLSALSGEFSYGFSFSMIMIFMGILSGLTGQRGERWDAGTARWIVLGALILFLIGTSHGFTLIMALIAGIFVLFFYRYWWRRFWILSWMFGIGILLMSGWLFQLYCNIPYSTPFNIAWTFGSIYEIFPRMLIPFQVAYVIISFMTLIFFKSSRQFLTGNEIRFLGLSWYLILVSILLFLVSEPLGLPDIRFLPFIQFFSSVLGIAYTGILFPHISTKASIAVSLTIAAFLWLTFFDAPVEAQLRWNLSGFEMAPRWTDYERLNRYLSGSYDQQRVAYENYHTTEDMGSLRAFESLPLFAHRQTLEGLYFQSSLLSPSVFYAQSLYSKEISCPFPDYTCASMDMKRAYEYLNLFNVGQLILISPTVKNAALQYPHLYERQYFRPESEYEVWNVINTPGYVQILDQEPEFVGPENFRFRFYQWFRDYSPASRFLATRPNRHALLYGLDAIPEKTASAPMENKAGKCEIKETVGNEFISFSTTCPGKPHLIKVAYHPGWESEGAIGPYLAAPGFLLVYPTRPFVKLFFDNKRPRIIGLVMASMGAMLFILFTWAGIIKPVFWIDRIWQRMDSWKGMKWIYRLFLVFSFLSFILVLYGISSPGYQRSFRNAELHYIQKDYKDAQRGFEKITDKWSDYPNIDRAYYFLGLCYYLDHDYAASEKTFTKLTREFKDSYFCAEAYYHIGLCALQRREYSRARSAFAFIIDGLKDPNWSIPARDRLKELSQINAPYYGTGIGN